MHRDVPAADEPEPVHQDGWDAAVPGRCSAPGAAQRPFQEAEAAAQFFGQEDHHTPLGHTVQVGSAYVQEVQT